LTDALNTDEFNKVLADFRSEDAGVREEAIGQLSRLIFTTLGDPSGDPSGETEPTEEQQRQWDEAKHQLMSRPDIAGALLSALNDSNAGVRAKAALSLAWVKPETGEHALISHLQNDPAGIVRWVCVSSLDNRWYRASLEVFTGALNDPDDYVISYACITLGRMGDTRAVEPLHRLFSHATWRARYGACEALVRLNAVDNQVVAALEVLVEEPEGIEHEAWIKRSNKVDADMEMNIPPSLTPREVLEKARQMLESRT
jgi:HEAT repeat protein